MAHTGADPSKGMFPMSFGSGMLSITDQSGKERATQKFGSISGINDESQDNMHRITGLGLSPTGIGHPKLRLTSREDANLLLFLQENEE